METKRLIFEKSEFRNLSQLEKIEEKLAEAGELIRKGEVVAFPTETVYGLGANALDAGACRKIFAIKGRPQDNPLIVHVSSSLEAEIVAADWPEQAYTCARAFWPGPLTMVLPKSAGVPDVISAGLQTIAVRMPSHPIALALIRVSGCPIAAPSANISGKPSPTNGRHVWRDLNGRIPLIIDGGQSQVGLESTVLDLSTDIPTILRPGGVTKEDLEHVLGRIELDKALYEEKENLNPRSPGMKYRHYAPEGIVEIVSEVPQKAAAKISEEVLKYKESDRRIGVLCLEETSQELRDELKQDIDLLYILGSGANLHDAAARLFEGLRLCDENRIEKILVQAMSSQGIGLAFMNRLQKAAGVKTGTEESSRLK